MKYLKRSIYVLLLAAIVLALLYFIPLPRDIDMSLPCVIWDMDDPSAWEPEGMEIKGRYYSYLLKDDVFKGEIRISEVNEWDEILDMKIYLSDVRGIKMGSLHYYSGITKDFELTGSLYMQGRFENIFIGLYVDENSPLNDKYVSAPATNIEEAQAIAESMGFA